MRAEKEGKKGTIWKTSEYLKKKKGGVGVRTELDNLAMQDTRFEP